MRAAWSLAPVLIASAFAQDRPACTGSSCCTARELARQLTCPAEACFTGSPGSDAAASRKEDCAPPACQDCLSGLNTPLGGISGSSNHAELAATYAPTTTCTGTPAVPPSSELGCAAPPGQSSPSPACTENNSPAGALAPQCIGASTTDDSYLICAEALRSTGVCPATTSDGRGANVRCTLSSLSFCELGLRVLGTMPITIQLDRDAGCVVTLPTPTCEAAWKDA